MLTGEHEANGRQSVWRTVLIVNSHVAVQQGDARCISGRFLGRSEQNTQQSPFFGRSNTRILCNHKNKQASVSIVSSRT